MTDTLTEEMKNEEMFREKAEAARKVGNMNKALECEICAGHCRRQIERLEKEETNAAS